MYRPALAFLILCCAMTASPAQETSGNTLSFEPAAGSPPATLSDISWIQGHWLGEAFGGITEEFWTPPLGGSMMSAFKLVAGGEVQFYEIQTIAEVNGTLILRLKHFHASLRGWEKKDETVDFQLVKVTPDKVYFDEFTFERVSEDELNIYVVIKNEGTQQEMRFPYTRVMPQ